MSFKNQKPLLTKRLLIYSTYLAAMIKRMRQAWAKLLFCIQHTENFIESIKLIRATKSFNQRYKAHQYSAQDQSLLHFKFTCKGIKMPLLIRAGTGDISMLYEVFYTQQYFIPAHLIHSVKTIIDLGANVGTASLYFHTQYPQAKIIAVEASENNFKVLEKNIRPFKNITALHAAIYSEDGEVLFEESDLAYNSKIGNNKNGQPVKALHMNTLMQQQQIDTIDLLKIDIEGAEAFILTQNNEWLQKVKQLIIELHAPFDMQALEQSLHPFGFTIYAPPLHNLKMIYAVNNKA